MSSSQFPEVSVQFPVVSNQMIWSLNTGHWKLTAGVDEAGRGPLAGPLVVSAVILKPEVRNPILNDSKQLTEKKRELLYKWVIEKAIDYTIEIISPKEIDELNILQATLYGMKLSVEHLKTKPDLALFDGNRYPTGLSVPCQAIVKGDSKYACIAAASILAKVTRDRIMQELDKKYPQYAFKIHKGYPTAKHITLLKQYGVCPEHRLSYKPVKDIVETKLFDCNIDRLDN